MIYTAIDNFYLTDEQLKDSPSRKDGIDEAIETTLRIYGCDLVQESGILLKLYPLLISLSNRCWFMEFLTHFLNVVEENLGFLSIPPISNPRFQTFSK